MLMLMMCSARNVEIRETNIYLQLRGNLPREVVVAATWLAFQSDLLMFLGQQQVLRSTPCFPKSLLSH